MEKSEVIQSRVEEIELSMLNQESELYKVFVEHINKMREDIR